MSPLEASPWNRSRAEMETGRRSPGFRNQSARSLKRTSSPLLRGGAIVSASASTPRAFTIIVFAFFVPSSSDVSSTVQVMPWGSAPRARSESRSRTAASGAPAGAAAGPAPSAAASSAKAMAVMRSSLGGDGGQELGDRLGDVAANREPGRREGEREVGGGRDEAGRRARDQEEPEGPRHPDAEDLDVRGPERAGDRQAEEEPRDHAEGRESGRLPQEEGRDLAAREAERAEGGQLARALQDRERHRVEHREGRHRD